MMPIDVMHTRETEPRQLDTTSLNVWPPAPGIPDLGPLRIGQLDDKYRRIDTITVLGRDDTDLRAKLVHYASVHGRLRVAFTERTYDRAVVAVWTSR